MAIHAARIQPSAAPAADPEPLRSRQAAALLLLRFAAVMTLALAFASLPASSLFAIRTVRVEGAVHTPPSEIVRWTGLRLGEPLFAVPAREVAARVAAHPRVARAAVAVGRSGLVVVRVVERAARAAVPFRGGFLILDPSGVVIEQRPSAGSLPIVTALGFAPPWVRLGDHLPSGGVDQALAALEVLPPGLVSPGTRLRAEPGGDIVLFTPDGIAVRLGPLRGLEDRSALLGELLDAVRDRGLVIEYLDLRFSGNVVMKPVPEAGREGEGGSR